MNDKKIELTTDEKQILMHMLGIENPKRLPAKFCRNSFSAGDDHEDMPTLKSLQEKGLVNSGYSNISKTGHFWVTEAGCKTIRKEKILR